MAAKLSERSLYHPNIDNTISMADNYLGYVLKTEQEQSLLKFVAGNDVFVSLATGFGNVIKFVAGNDVFVSLATGFGNVIKFVAGNDVFVSLATGFGNVIIIYAWTIHINYNNILTYNPNP